MHFARINFRELAKKNQNQEISFLKKIIQVKKVTKEVRMKIKITYDFHFIRVFTTLSNIYDWVFFQKYLTAFSR